MSMQCHSRRTDEHRRAWAVEAVTRRTSVQLDSHCGTAQRTLDMPVQNICQHHTALKHYSCTEQLLSQPGSQIRIIGLLFD